jgi:hypothetical protein
VILIFVFFDAPLLAERSGLRRKANLMWLACWKMSDDWNQWIDGSGCAASSSSLVRSSLRLRCLET